MWQEADPIQINVKYISSSQAKEKDLCQSEYNMRL